MGTTHYRKTNRARHNRVMLLGRLLWRCTQRTNPMELENVNHPTERVRHTHTPRLSFVTRMGGQRL